MVNVSAMLYTFNVDTPSSIRRCASESGVEIRPFNVVYRLVDALKDDLSKALPEETERVLIGEGHVLKVRHEIVMGKGIS